MRRACASPLSAPFHGDVLGVSGGCGGQGEGDAMKPKKKKRQETITLPNGRKIPVKKITLEDGRTVFAWIRYNPFWE
jgi:hypothetical protein